MKTCTRLLSIPSRLLWALPCLTLSISSVRAQSPVPDAAALAKYDTNKNGRLDPDEVAAMEADKARSPGEPTVQLSPFEVVEDTKGYYASNTMSGTRMNSKIEDLASSITVVTKEQMSDFAMLDINDVFLYTAGTEGSGTYTAYSTDRNGSVSDSVQLSPTTANRVRGIAPANISLGNYETTARTPVDPISIDGVEVSRGPNANVFGLGNPSGTVNQVPASANLNRNSARTQLRVDDLGGYRTSLDVNRYLLKGKLGVRGSAVFQQDEFVRKPSGVRTERYNGMIKYQPFKNTQISAFVNYYNSYGNRPNFSPPRDNVSYWLASGKPTWDPVNQVVHVNGTTLGPFTTATGLPDYFTATFTGSTHNFAYVDQGTVGYWTTPVTTLATSPLTAALATATSGTARLLATTPAANSALGKITTQPLFSTTPSVSSKAMYDWEDVNIASVNFTRDRSVTSNIQLDQYILNTQRNQLALQFGFFREDTQRYQRNLIGTANDNGQSGQLFIDINETNLDGSKNPYFLRPYIGTDQPRTVSQPWKWDTYRAQLAYKLDLTQEKNALKWLGLHQLTGYDEYKYRIQRSFSYRDAISDDHPWIPAGTIRGNQGGVTGGPAAAPNLTRSYFRYYLGDANGSNIDYAPTNFSRGNYPFVWGGAGGVFNRETATLGEVAVTDAAGGGSNSKTIIKTAGAVLQSHFLDDRLVTTLGRREDKVYTKFGSTAQLNADGKTYNYVAMNAWAPGDYRYNSGNTDSLQVVGRPLRDMNFVRRMDSETTGIAKVIGETLAGLSLTANWSNSFLPQAPAQDLHRQILPNSTGTDRTFGLGLTLFKNKLVVSVRHYETKQLNARNGDANTVATRVARIDIGTGDSFNFVLNARAWAQANPAFTSSDQVEAEVTRVTGLSTATQQFLTSPVPGLAATNDITSKGTEIELNFNPTRFWTVAANATEGRSVNSNVSTVVADWIKERMPFWLSAIDTRTNTPWWTTGYGGNSVTPSANFASFVQAPYNVIQQTQGKSNSQIRRYNFRLSTNYQLAGITENKLLSRFNVGGALRWEDKASIGYYGVQSLPAVITALDPNRPIYDKARTYVDLFLGYKTRLFNNRIPTTLQLNVRNIQESGRLQAIGAYPDGTPNAYRIVDPRQFILQATFDL